MRNLLYLIFLILLTSCYAEWRLARSYIKSEPEVSILLLPTHYVFKTNLKTFEVSNRNKMSQPELDSALMENSIFLREISDSVFLETFINSMIIEFEKLGYAIYSEHYLDSFLLRNTPAIILHIAQIELEEHYVVHEDEEQFGDFIYYKNFDLNAVTFNFWFELSVLNDQQYPPQVFYASETLTDQINGYFTENLFTGKVNYRYHISALDLDVIYRYARIFGEQYAGYTFDHLMNRHIYKNHPRGKEPRYYMHYKRWNNTINPTTKDRFFRLEQ
jgi:hypothetical protein